jgi:hypothetical protein
MTRSISKRQAGVPEERKERQVRCEAILRAWLDDTLNRLSLESGGYGNLHSLVLLLELELGK